MTKSLVKTQKRIAKKRGGAIDSLHQNSRDSKRLHKAAVRDERLAKLAAARSKKEQPIIDRVKYFQGALQEKGGGPMEMEVVRELVTSFVHRHDEELNLLKKLRRPGRPSSSREDLVKMKISNLETEYEEGFLLPDLTAAENVAILNRWEGSWPYLTNLSWVRVTAAGVTRPAGFPPNGEGGR